MFKKFYSKLSKVPNTIGACFKHESHKNQTLDDQYFTQDYYIKDKGSINLLQYEKGHGNL